MAPMGGHRGPPENAPATVLRAGDGVPGCDLALQGGETLGEGPAATPTPIEIIE